MRWAALALATAVLVLAKPGEGVAHHRSTTPAPEVVADSESRAVIKIFGIGASTCGEFGREIAIGAEPGRTYFAWAQGFMSRIMARAPTGTDEGIDLTPRDFPLQGQADFIRSPCVQNRTADYSDGVLALYRELRRRFTL